MKKVYLIAFIIVLSNGALGLDFLTEKPEYLTACSIRDLNFGPCSTKTMQQLFDQIRDGIPGLKTLQRSDPYHIHKVKLAQNNDAATLKAELSNVVIKGLGKAVAKDNRVDAKDYTWTTKFFIPNLRVDADYKMDGRLLIVTLKGQGKMFVELEDIDMTLVTKVHLYEKGGFTFGNVTNVKLDFTIKNLKTHLDNLFNGAVELEESLNAVLNENWMVFLEALRPTLTHTVENIFQDDLEKIFHFIPAKYFISDIPTSNELYGS